MNEINMTMLGPSRVGKTSLLASMYRELSLIECDFEFLPDETDSTALRLDASIADLSNMAKTGQRFKVIGPESGLAGNQGFQTFTFNVGHNNKKQFDLKLHDYRGGVIKEGNTLDLAKLKKYIQKSHVIFNLVDCVPFMELDRLGSEKHNSHQRISEILASTLSVNREYLIIFSLVKGERYLNQGESKQKELLARFKEAHKAVLNKINQMNKAGAQIATVTIPVQTLGNVEFQQISFDEEKKAEVFEYLKVRRDYSPVDVDQPLRYALAFALNAHEDGLGFLTKWKKYFTGEASQFRKALENFYKTRKDHFEMSGKLELLRD